MADFPTPSSSPSAPNPSYGINKANSPTVLETRYGDGYSSRTVFGLNQNLKSYSLNWRNISETSADVIDNFLSAREGRDSFNWTPPGDTSGKYICRKWNKTIPYLNVASITATFEEVAEP